MKFVDGKAKILTKHLFFGKPKVKRTKDYIEIDNSTDAKQKVILPRLLHIKSRFARIVLGGEIISGSDKVELRFIDLKKKVTESANFNNTSLLILREDYVKRSHYLLYINVPAHTKVRVKEISVCSTDEYTLVDYEKYQNDVLVITPMYPSIERPYSATFVYSKVKKYLEYGIDADVAVVSTNEKKLYNYYFDDKLINKVSFDELRNIVQKHHYKKILVHFLDYEIGNALLACDLDNTDVLIYCHGADVDLWNQEINGHYFENEYVFTPHENRVRERRLNTIKKFESLPNAIWIFNTKWNLKNTQQVTGLKFDNHKIIPCIINEDLFPYKQRGENDRTKILVLKKMDNVRQYAVDLAVNIIKKLSKKPYFDKLSFTVAGAGDFQKELTNPLHKYSNVNIIKGFFQNDKMHEVYSEHGILLAPSRYDTQGVTACEAAMSGLVVVGSKNTGLSDMLPEELGTFFDNNNIDEAVDIIDQIYNKKLKMSALSKNFHDAICKTASAKNIEEEINLLKKNPIKIDRLNPQLNDATIPKNPTLSIVIPAYNASQYIVNAVKSLTNQSEVNKLEIIIVNDGSKDNTAEVVKNMMNSCGEQIKDRIVFIDKENGGHGSTINAGLKVAKGKYFRIMDADDRLDSDALASHIRFLSKCDADIVFTNTVHDLSIPSKLKPDHKYDFMTPHKVYDFDDLCEEYYGFPGYGPVLSTSSIKTEKLRNTGCNLTEKCFYVDIEYNYFLTEAADTAVLDPVDLYYYYLGRSGQSLATESYKKNFNQHLLVLETVIELLERNKLSKDKYDHFVRVQLHETMHHQYRIALDMFNNYKKFKIIEKALKKYPKYYNDSYLVPGRVFRLRKYKFPFFFVRKIYIKLLPFIKDN